MLYLQYLWRVLSILIKTFYVALRIFLRIILGKTKREKLQFYHKLDVYVYSISFSFYFFMFLYKTIKICRLGNPSLVKIIVPKYNYKVYCNLTGDDYVNMTTKEEEIIEKFQPRDGEIVIDIGAHSGRYTLIATKRVGPKGKVIAIEADPKNFDMLNKNIKLNDLSTERM